MPHKADKSFFDFKRPWSERKDKILGYYLTPYLAKVAYLRKPILILDGFAGPGRFVNGEPGSPIIICEKALEAIKRGTHVDVYCVEPNKELFGKLKTTLKPYSFARTIPGSFLDSLTAHVLPMVRTHTIFLYLDPYTVNGLEWEPLDSVFQNLARTNASIELLLNFNSDSFMRRALAALKRDPPPLDLRNEDSEVIEIDHDFLPHAADLDKVVGGEWWRDIALSEQDHSSKVNELTQKFSRRLGERFREVGHIPIKAEERHTVQKYDLIYCSRSIDGLKLMNDSMAKARGESVFFTYMFSKIELEELILETADKPIIKGKVIERVVRERFALYLEKEINRSITELLKCGKLASSTGKSRINNSVEIRRI